MFGKVGYSIESHLRVCFILFLAEFISPLSRIQRQRYLLFPSLNNVNTLLCLLCKPHTPNVRMVHDLKNETR